MTEGVSGTTVLSSEASVETALERMPEYTDASEADTDDSENVAAILDNPALSDEASDDSGWAVAMGIPDSDASTMLDTALLTSDCTEDTMPDKAAAPEEVVPGPNMPAVVVCDTDAIPVLEMDKADVTPVATPEMPNGGKELDVKRLMVGTMLV